MVAAIKKSIKHQSKVVAEIWGRSKVVRAGSVHLKAAQEGLMSRAEPQRYSQMGAGVHPGPVSAVRPWQVGVDYPAHVLKLGQPLLQKMSCGVKQSCRE